MTANSVNSYIQRPLYTDKLKLYANTDLVKVLTGLRRSGKSVILDLVRNDLIEQGVEKQNLVLINFEDLRNARICTAETLHAEILRLAESVNGRLYLFLDEIQEVADWEKCINSLRVVLDCDIYLTGSNAKLLSGELATYLSGRYIEIEVYPFSFGEFSAAYGAVFPEADERQTFAAYLKYGGMPYLHALKYDNAISFEYLRSIFDSVELKDIIKRENIRDADLLERIVTFIMAEIGHTFSARSIARYLKDEGRQASPETILNYVRACCNAFLFQKVPRQEVQGKKILRTNEKYYASDHGIREALLGSNAADIQLVLENIVFLELKRRGYQVMVGANGKQEIDFVAHQRGERLYIQVAYLLASPETVNREFGSFAGIPDHYPRIVISMDELDMSRNGVRHWNIRDFLLARSWS